jgi:hypothetical protein
MGAIVIDAFGVSSGRYPRPLYVCRLCPLRVSVCVDGVNILGELRSRVKSALDFYHVGEENVDKVFIEDMRELESRICTVNIALANIVLVELNDDGLEHRPNIKLVSYPDYTCFQIEHPYFSMLLTFSPRAIHGSTLYSMELLMAAGVAIT